jgi:hypothetical protein
MSPLHSLVSRDEHFDLASSVSAACRLLVIDKAGSGHGGIWL